MLNIRAVIGTTLYGKAIPQPERSTPSTVLATHGYSQPQRVKMDMILVELDGRDVTGDPFDAVMELLLSKPEGVPIDLVFRDRSAQTPPSAPLLVPPPPKACVIRAFGTNGKEVIIEANVGDNLRKKLLESKVDVYDAMGKVRLPSIPSLTRRHIFFLSSRPSSPLFDVS